MPEHGPTYSQKKAEERRARKLVPACDHCGAGKAWGTLEVQGKVQNLCAGCASAWKRTGKLPEVAQPALPQEGGC